MGIRQHFFKDGRTARIVLLLASVIPLAAAYIGEMGFDLQPCILCLYQRYVLMVIGGLALMSFIIPSAYVIFLCALCFLGGAGLAFYQVGVEQHIFQLPEVCKASHTATTMLELKKQLMQKPVIPCDQVTFQVFGISMAGYNGLFSMVMFLYSWTIFRGIRS